VRLVPLAYALAAGAVLLLPQESAAQAQAAAPQLPGCAVNCYNVVLPYGLYVSEVIDDGSYVKLEDGSVWEIRLPQRPVASSWQAGDFVQLKTIAAPVDRFEILLTHGDYDKAEARLVGRDRAPEPEWPQE
jgi:hypothetical protein